MFAGIFLMICLSIGIAIYNSNTKKKYAKSVLSDAASFKKKWLDEYTEELKKSELPEEERFTANDFSNMLDSYITYLQTGGKETFDVYMNKYFANWAKEKREVK